MSDTWNSLMDGVSVSGQIEHTVAVTEDSKRFILLCIGVWLVWNKVF